jgi:hypothetical protein
MQIESIEKMVTLAGARQLSQGSHWKDQSASRELRG